MQGRWVAASVAAVVLVAGAGLTAFVVHERSDKSPTGALTVNGTDAGPAAGVTSGSPLSETDRTPSPGPVSPGATSGMGSTTAATRPATTAAKPATGATKPASGVTKRPSASTPADPAGSGTPSLAGRIKPGATYRGLATWYRTDGGGACLYGAGGDPMTAAMNSVDYEGSQACGAYVRVRAANGRTITVQINNVCPAPCRVHQLDLSPQAFAKLADPKTGQLDVTWQLLSPAITGGISVRYKVGSSQYWCGIQVINHRNPVAALEVRAGSTWRRLARADFNYFLSPHGSGCGGDIRVTDIYTQRLVVASLPVKPDVVQPTGLQFARH